MYKEKYLIQPLETININISNFSFDENSQIKE